LNLKEIREKLLMSKEDPGKWRDHNYCKVTLPNTYAPERRITIT
jgi:hypothetical protein